MKRKLFRVLFATFLLVGLGFMAISCGSEDYLDEFEVRRMIQEELKKNNQNLEFTQWKIVNISVAKKDWQWNDEARQYEAFADLPELTEFIYEEGAVLGYVFLGQQGVDEVQKALPYINTYSYTDEHGNTMTFTETISYDVQFGKPSTVAFFIKDSELAKDEDAPQDYNFRIVLIW